MICPKTLGVRSTVRLFHSTKELRIDEDIEMLAEMASNRSGYARQVIEKRPYRLPQTLFDAFLSQKKHDTDSTFRDVALSRLQSGRGGNGCISFLRQSHMAVGPPDGGDGGRGGDIYVKADPGMTTLRTIRQAYTAENGHSGGSAQLTGRNGKNVVIPVPVGTTIWWTRPLPELRRMRDELPEEIKRGGQGVLESEEEYNVTFSRFSDLKLQLTRPSYADGEGWHFKDKDGEKGQEFYNSQSFFRELVSRVRPLDAQMRRAEREEDVFPVEGVTLNTAGETVRLLSGGLGGLGNTHFQSSDIRSPRFAKIGRAGLYSTVFFEMRLVADLGLVGLPNAGKSTLLRAISRARPRVGHWEFTTLWPSIGTVDMGISQPPFTVADIPGIVQGASENKGLGIGFLRHIERCKTLVFVVALDKPNPGESLEILLNELGTKRLEGKNALVVATKGDLPDAEQAFQVLKERALELSDEWKLPLTLVPCSAHNTTSNIEHVLEAMASSVAEQKAKAKASEDRG